MLTFFHLFQPNNTHPRPLAPTTHPCTNIFRQIICQLECLTYLILLLTFFYISVRSESPSQAFLFLLEWMLAILKDIPDGQWGDIFIAYDNMCHIDGMKVAQKALPFSPPYDEMWLKVNKVIDSLHIANHKSEECKRKYNPEKVKEKLPDGNTMAGEQTFTWLSRFKRILCSMPKVHHMFFLHRMVVRRNAYTVLCYKNGKKPVLPKARKEFTHWSKCVRTCSLYMQAIWRFSSARVLKVICIYWVFWIAMLIDWL